jgi:hypothetical protein
MRDRIDDRPWQAPSSPRRRRGGLLWTTLAALAVGGLFAARRSGGPESGRYRLERIDRGPIRNEVAAPGTVSAVPVARDRGDHVGDSRTGVQVAVSEADMARVAVGEAATLRCPADPGRVRTGTVSELRAVPGPVQGSVAHTVLVEADNLDHKLRPGMKATVIIEVARRDGVLRLPLRALSFAPPGMEPPAPATAHVGRVFVLDHGWPRPVRVTVGLQDRLHAELVAGPLREGDAVIVERAPGRRLNSGGG